jgi:hypothetical protein
MFHMTSKESGYFSQSSNRLEAGRPGIDSRHGKLFLNSTKSRPALEPTQSAIQWVPGAISLEVKRLGRGADHLHQVPKSRRDELYLHSAMCLHGMVLN